MACIENIESMSQWNSSQSKDNDETASSASFEPSPKRLKLSTNCEFFYHTLFVDKKYSDVTIIALEKKWRLHKNMLSQSSFFVDMFTDPCASEGDCFNVEISDKNITVQSLEAVFASLYLDEVDLDSDTVIPMLATASLFNLQGLIDKCEEMMRETTSIKNASSYYETAIIYKLESVKAIAIQILSLHFYNFSFRQMREISPDCMANIVSSQYLATGNEFHTYNILKKWIFAHSQDPDDQTMTFESFYAEHSWTKPFLFTKEGIRFLPPFQVLKKKYLLTLNTWCKTVENDNLLSEEWMNAAYKELWQTELQILSGSDMGPVNISDVKFEAESFRIYIKKITAEHVEKGKITPFQLFGLDFEIHCSTSSLIIRRCDQPSNRSTKANLWEHNVVFRVVVHSSKDHKQLINSDLLYTSFKENEERVLMSFEGKVLPPFLVFLKVLLHTPSTEIY